MKTSLLLATTFSLVAGSVTPAMAQMDPARFPMPAAEYERHVERRIARAHDRLERAIAQGEVAPAQANGLRAEFDSVVAQVKAEVGKAVADGKVTFDEARAVHAVARQLRRLVHRQPAGGGEPA